MRLGGRPRGMGSGSGFEAWLRSITALFAEPDEASTSGAWGLEPQSYEGGGRGLGGCLIH